MDVTLIVLTLVYVPIAELETLRVGEMVVGYLICSVGVSGVKLVVSPFVILKLKN